MLRLMSYNIRFGGVGREKRIADVIRHCTPDIVLLQEATREAGVAEIAKHAEMPYWGAKQGHSPAFISRVAVDHFEWHHHRDMQRPFLEIRLADSDLTLFNIHLRATHSNYTERGRMREVRALLDAITPATERFHLLVGDFNTLAPGELLNMQKLPMRYRVLAFLLGGRVTYRTIQIMLDAGYLDGYRRLNTDHGFTFPAWDPHARLDYIFVPKNFIDRVISCEVVSDIPQPAKATDHLPLRAAIEIKP
jgi:endonuclease/exonuclease/phosphatase family metal-dependent hydrolase